MPISDLDFWISALWSATKWPILASSVLATTISHLHEAVSCKERKKTEKWQILVSGIFQNLFWLLVSHRILLIRILLFHMNCVWILATVLITCYTKFRSRIVVRRYQHYWSENILYGLDICFYFRYRIMFACALDVCANAREFFPPCIWNDTIWKCIHFCAKWSAENVSAFNSSVANSHISLLWLK